MKKINTYINQKWLAALLMIFAMPFAVSAQEAEPGALNNPEVLLTVVLGLVLIVAILVLIVALYMVRVIKLIMSEEKKAKATSKAKTEGLTVEEVLAEDKKESWWKSVNQKLTDAVPVEKEETVMLDHDYDGIKELDNHLPPWWTGLFYFTIAWGIIYLLVYHVFGLLPLSEEEYEIQMAKAEAQKEEMMKLAENSIDESTVEFTDNVASLESGKNIYLNNCAVCHGREGQGGVGPNMTDKYWIHGGSIQDVFKTIKYGVPQKGMISWQNSLTPPQMRDVSSYILTLQGTNPANQKAPEGELYEPEEGPESTEGTETEEQEPVEETVEAESDTVELALN